MGVTSKTSFDAQKLQIASHMQPVFERLMSGLVRRGLLEKKEGGWKAPSSFIKAADCADKILRDYIEKHPDIFPKRSFAREIAPSLDLSCAAKRCGAGLFSGNGSELLDHFYGDGLFSSHWIAGIAAAVSQAARSLPEGRGLRILEIGAGTGGLASQVLPLLERGLHSYLFTDISASFFSAAAQKLAAFPEVEFKAFDLEKPGVDQELAASGFDFIIGTNVLHAVSDVRAALRNLHHLLAPGGSLIFMDTATPQLWTETVFGLTSGWWRFTDRDLRPEQPLLKRAQWEEVLRETGFAEIASLPGLIGPTGGEGQIGLFARKSYEEIESSAESQCVAPEERSWLIFTDPTALGAKLFRAFESWWPLPRR
jgi:SAM-dependent methyltransferase